jgi:hypothetical protein
MMVKADVSCKRLEKPKKEKKQQPRSRGGGSKGFSLTTWK